MALIELLVSYGYGYNDTPDPENPGVYDVTYDRTSTFWNTDTRQLETSVPYPERFTFGYSGAREPTDWSKPITELVDAYVVPADPSSPGYLADKVGHSLRLFHDGNGGIRYEEVNLLQVITPIPTKRVGLNASTPGTARISVVPQFGNAQITAGVYGSLDNGAPVRFDDHNGDYPPENRWSYSFEVTDGQHVYTCVVTSDDGQAALTATFVVGQETASGISCDLQFVGYSATSPASGQTDGTLTVRMSGGTGKIILQLFLDGTQTNPFRETSYDTTRGESSGTFQLLPAGLYILRGYVDAHASCTIQLTPAQTSPLELEVPLPDLVIGDQLTFVPWVQPELLHAAQAGSGPRPTLRLSARLQTDGPTGGTEDVATTSGQLYGPADVLGISQRAILGTTPAPDAQGFSPLQLAAVEFQDEDLPWRYSTRQAADGTPLPWLQLLVLEASEYETLPLAGQALPGLRLTAVGGSAYPDPTTDQPTLWAHVQLNASLDTGTPNEPPGADAIRTFLNDTAPSNPDLAYSRLFCPRRLKADTAYHAFLVPALEAGRQAGLGLPVTAGLADAASLSTLDGQFPVYFQWQFATGAEEDFETLVGQLHQANAATAAASAPTLGVSLPAAPAPINLPMPGLLTDAAADPSVQVGTPPVSVARYLYQQLAPGFAAPSVPARPRPLVAAPLYGRAYMVQPSLLDPTGGIPDSWKHSVNLDPRYRALAALGAQVVRDNQEEYVRRAWDQVQDLLLANERLRGLQYGLHTTAGLRTQHLPLNTTTITTTTTSSFSSGARASQQAATNSFAGAGPPDDGSGGENPAADAAIASETSGVLTTGVPITGNPSAPVLADYGLHLTGLSQNRVRLPRTAAAVAAGVPAALAGLTVREALRRSRTPLAAFSPAFRRIIKPFGNYMVGEAGRPLRPTQPEPVAPEDAGNPRDLRGTSLRQRDTLLSALSSGQLTAAPTRPNRQRAYQFADGTVDTLLLELSATPTPFAPRAVALATPAAQAAFARAFGEFTDLGAQADGTREVLGFVRPQFLRPLLPLAPLRDTVVAGTRPGPVVAARVRTIAPALPPPPSYAPGDYEGGDFDADQFYVGDDELIQADFSATDFSAADFLVGVVGLATPAATPLLLTASASASASWAETNSVSANASAGGSATTTTTTSVVTQGVVIADALPLIQPAKAYPVFKDPMGEPLRQRHPELFVPGLGDFPAGGVAVLGVNQAFIEAYMVGLNHALGSELRWRGFPVEERGTFFQQFWDVSEHFSSTLPPGTTPTAAQEAALLDIAPIDRWVGNPLGQNRVADHAAPSSPAPVPSPLRVALRSELLRRYPTLVIGLQPATTGSAVPGPDDDLSKLRSPLQRLAVGQDLVLVTFDKSLAQARADGDYLLLLERPGQPKFGLDELPDGGDATQPPLSWDEASWEYFGTAPGSLLTIPAGGLGRPHATAEPASVSYLTDSAALAYALFQQPILAALPVTELLPD